MSAVDIGIAVLVVLDLMVILRVRHYDRKREIEVPFGTRRLP